MTANPVRTFLSDIIKLINPKDKVSEEVVLDRKFVTAAVFEECLFKEEDKSLDLSRADDWILMDGLLDRVAAIDARTRCYSSTLTVYRKGKSKLVMIVATVRFSKELFLALGTAPTDSFFVGWTKICDIAA